MKVYIAYLLFEGETPHAIGVFSSVAQATGPALEKAGGRSRVGVRKADPGCPGIPANLETVCREHYTERD